MKKILLTSTLIISMFLSFAAEKDYVKKMEQNLKELNSAKSAADYLSLAESFEMIADEKPGEWLPLYYVSFAYANYVFTEGAKLDLDMILDKADAYLKKAREISPKNSEIEVLQGWIYQGRIQVDPMGRGMTYSQKAAESFGKAKNLNPENPRIYFLLGLNVRYTPEQFGGGKKAACPYFHEAEGKYKSIKPETSISPNWGKEYNRKQAIDCK